MYNKIKEQDEEELVLVYHFRHHNKKSPSKIKTPSSRKENLKKSFEKDKNSPTSIYAE